MTINTDTDQRILANGAASGSSGGRGVQVNLNGNADDLPVHDDKAEAGALACVVTADPGDAQVYLSQLTLDQFYDVRHRSIFRALMVLRDDGKPLDAVSLYQWLRNKGQSDEAGGDLYLATLSDATPSPANFPTYLDTLNDLMVRRAVMRDSAGLTDLARNLAIPADTLADAARRMSEAFSNAGTHPDKLTLRRPDDLLAMTFDETDRIVGDRLLAKGQSLVIAGAGSMGKSRLLLQLAVATITGRPFVGFETRRQELRWLILQAENSNRRLQADLAALREWTGPKIWPQVNERLFIHTLESDADGFLSLDNPKAQQRVAEAIKETKPDVIAFDSLYNFGVGNINTDEDMAGTLLIMSRLSRAGNPDRAILILHHALTGLAGASRATGFDRASFGRNSKVLHSWTRAQLNIAPGSPDSNYVLVLSCGKLSNGPEFQPFAIRLNPDTMIYEVAGDFDLPGWQVDVGAQKPSVGVTIELVRNVCKGKMTKRQLVKAVMDETGCQKSMAYRMIDRAKNAKMIHLNPTDDTYLAN